MSTYHLPGKGVPAVLRKAAGLARPGGSQAKSFRSLKDVVGLAQVAVKVYRDMLRTPDEPPPLEPPAEAPPPTEAGRLRQRADNVWLALGLVGHDIITDTGGETAEAPTEEEAMLEEVGWDFFERLDRIIQTLLRWVNLSALFLSRFFFFEFPNNLRHLCTTMPWSIWPALVVLWGVCWMFYGEAEERRNRPQDLEVPQQQFSPLTGYLRSSVSPFDLRVFSPPAPMQNDPFIWNSEGFSTSDLPLISSWAQDPTSLSPAAYQPNGQAFAMWPEASPGLNTAGFGGPVTGASAALGLLPLETSNEFMATPKGTQTSGHSTSMSLGTPPTSPAVPTGHGSPVSAEAPGQFKCGRPGCKARPFDSANDLRRHRARHDRRSKCTCGKDFGSNADLTRHRNTVHKEGPATDWICTVPSCTRTKGAFSRKDNWDKHMEAHKRKGHLAPSPSDPIAEGKGKGEDVAREVASGQAGPGCEGPLVRGMEKLQEENAALRREMEVEKAASEKRKARMWDLIENLQASLGGT